MSFEYELRPVTGAVTATIRAELRGLAGSRVGGPITITMGEGGRMNEATLHETAAGFLVVVESPRVLRAPALRSLLEAARSKGLELYEDGEKAPVHSSAS